MNDIDQNFVLLDTVCKKFFNLAPRVARHRGALGTLPIPAFRLTGTRKGPMYIRQTDLDKWIKDRVSSAEKLNSQMRLAGAV